MCAETLSRAAGNICTSVTEVCTNVVNYANRSWQWLMTNIPKTATQQGDRHINFLEQEFISTSPESSLNASLIRARERSSQGQEVHVFRPQVCLLRCVAKEEPTLGVGLCVQRFGIIDQAQTGKRD